MIPAPHFRTHVGLRRAALGIMAGSLAVVISACEDPPPRDLLPSTVGVEPGPEYAIALDSARATARLWIEERHIAGLSIAVGVDGEIVWSEGFGWADLSDKSPATSETLYPAGSISKSMTSVGVGVLYDRGVIDLDAPVQTYLPDFPEKEKGTLTTRQIMGHIAGLQNFGIYQALREEQCADLGGGLEVRQDDSLYWAPGERYYYSNYGYRMVGAILRSLIDEPYVEFMRREVFEPMGMTHTLPDTSVTVMPPGLSTPYNARSFNTLRRSEEVNMSCTLAEGGWLSTPSDLVRFGFGMLQHTVLEEETVDLWWTPQELNRGSQTSYGMGWSVGRPRLGHDEGTTLVVGHGGSTLGGMAHLMIDPESGLVVATMTNVRGRVLMSGLAGYVFTYFRDASTPQQP